MSAGTTVGCTLWNPRPIALNRSLGWRLSDGSTKNSRERPALARGTRRIIGIKRRLKLLAANDGKIGPALNRLTVTHQPQPPDGATGLVNISAAGLPHVIRAAVASAVGPGKICPTLSIDVFGSIGRANDIDRI